MKSDSLANFRKSQQRVAPVKQASQPTDAYSLYPAFPVGAVLCKWGSKFSARRLATQPIVRIDGDVGVLWNELHQSLDAALASLDCSTHWIDIRQALRPEAEIEQLVKPFLGGSDPLFGTRFTGHLIDFFNREGLASLVPKPQSELTILYGCGAGLVNWDGPLLYVDLPKNELQYRSRAGVISNLGVEDSKTSPQQQYKRFYFVDWPALNRHKEQILPRSIGLSTNNNPPAPLS